MSKNLAQKIAVAGSPLWLMTSVQTFAHSGPHAEHSGSLLSMLVHFFSEPDHALMLGASVLIGAGIAYRWLKRKQDS